MQPQLLYKFYELKGMIESLVELASYDDQYSNPLIDKLESKANELSKMLESDA